MEVTVRRAEAKDVTRMLKLVRELAVFEREPEAVTVSVEEMKDAGFGVKPVWLGWIAEVGPEVVGIAICYERYSTWKGRCLYLEDIVVTDAARGKGVGDRLLRACAAFTVEGGYHHMLWQVLDWNEGAIRFYERYGAVFSDEWLNVRLDKEKLKELVGWET